MANRAEDAMRRMMGMPSRKEEKRRARERQRRAERGEPDDDRTRESYYDGGATATASHEKTSDMMQSVAVDVEYTEFKEYSSETIIDGGDGKTRVKTEEQVSDAEYVEIKTSKDK